MENQGTTKVVKVNLPGGSQETATKVAGTGKGVIGHEEKTNRQVAKDTKVNNLLSLSTQRAGTNSSILFCLCLDKSLTHLTTPSGGKGGEEIEKGD